MHRMSQQTVEIHHGRHLDTYIKKLNNLIADTRYESMPLVEIIETSVDDTDAPTDDAGCVGTRVLPGLPEQARRFYKCMDGSLG